MWMVVKGDREDTLTLAGEIDEKAIKCLLASLAGDTHVSWVIYTRQVRVNETHE